VPTRKLEVVGIVVDLHSSTGRMVHSKSAEEPMTSASIVLRKLLAGTLDYLLFLLLVSLYIAAFGRRGQDNVYEIGGFAHFVSLAFLWILYFPICETYLNATPVMSLFKLKVVQNNGLKLAFGSALRRHLLDPIDVLVLSLVAFVPLLKPILGSRLGDLWAGTSVVEEYDSVEVSANLTPNQSIEIRQSRLHQHRGFVASVKGISIAVIPIALVLFAVENDLTWLILVVIQFTTLVRLTKRDKTKKAIRTWSIILVVIGSFKCISPLLIPSENFDRLVQSTVLGFSSLLVLAGACFLLFLNDYIYEEKINTANADDAADLDASSSPKAPAQH
jgi:uncharacterized RDD family membrane protein YckC